MSSRRCQAGSALLFVLLISTCLTVALIALVTFTGQTAKTASRAEQDAVARYAMQGILAHVRSDMAAGAVGAPQTVNYTLGRVSSTVTLTDNSSNINNTVFASQSASAFGRTYLSKKLMAKAGSIYDFALSINSPTTWSSSVDTTGAGVYVNGNLTVNSAGSTVNGDMVLGGTLGGSSAVTVTGARFYNSVAVRFPTVNYLDYQAAANVFYGAGTTINGYNFTTPYTLIYINGDAAIGGSFSGKGTIFVHGNTTISKATYGAPNSAVAIICDGDMGHDNGNTTTVGMYYAQGTFDNTSPPRMKNTQGFFMAGTMAVNKGLTITYDPLIQNNRQEAVNLKLPGSWP